jgi:hypothetical protein
MTQLRIFSYLPNPRVWKATIAARMCGVEVEVRGAAPEQLAEWLWDFDASPSERPQRNGPATRDRTRALDPARGWDAGVGPEANDQARTHERDLGRLERS